MTAAKTVPISNSVGQVHRETVMLIPIEDIHIAPWNARKTFDQAALDELTASIREHGIQAPLLIRAESVKEGEYFEIVCGHRRFAAAKQAGLAVLPCIERLLTDDQAREIGLVDNLQREDVPALEEADAYNELKQRLGTPAAIAARVGKDVSYVARRLQLVSLSELARKALQERLITVDHALLLARLGPDEQDVNLKWALSRNAGAKESVEDVIATSIKNRDAKGTQWRLYYEPQSPLELKQHIEQNVGRKLSRAPWKLDDAKLSPDVGACDVCPSNTKANDTLFGDLSIDAATCENGACFEEKRAAFVQIRLSEGTLTQARPELGPAIRLSWKSTTVKPRVSKPGGTQQFEDDGFSLQQTFKYGQWVDAKKGSCEHIRLGVTVDWSDDGNRGYMGSDKKLSKPGQILTVCIAEKCKVHRKGYEQPDRKGSGQAYDAKADEAKREQTKQASIAESKLRVAVASKAIEGIKALPAEALRALVRGRLRGADVRVCNAIIPGIDKVLLTAKVDSKEFAQAASLVSISENLEAPYWGAASDDRKEFLADVKRLGYDGSSAWLKPVATKPEKKPAAQPAPAVAKKAILSPAAKKRIADAQRKRWAKAQQAKKAVRK